MADNDVQVTFSGDASGLKAAVGDLCGVDPES